KQILNTSQSFCQHGLYLVASLSEQHSQKSQRITPSASIIAGFINDRPTQRSERDVYGLFILPFSKSMIENAGANPGFVLILSLRKVSPNRIQNDALFISNLCSQLIESNHEI